jgi:predicted lipoprotein with Yx(FWY)xxD motif
MIRLQDRLGRTGGARRGRTAALAVAVFAGLASGARAQPADLPILAATTDKYPPGVRVTRTPAGAVYADAKGRVLYGMDMRTLLRWGPDPSQYCVDQCATVWEPLLAPAGAAPNIAYPRDVERGRRGAQDGDPAAAPLRQPAFYTQRDAPDWTVIAGPQGPQWVYKGWHLVFTRRGDKPGSTTFDGAGAKTWNTLKFVPPVPKVTAPNNVQPIAMEGGYVLADSGGRVLFTADCADRCSDWRPFAAGMASAGVGDWTVDRTGDAPSWTYRGQPVFVASEDEPNAAPPGGKLLRP